MIRFLSTTLDTERKIVVDEAEKTYNLYHDHPPADHIGYAPEDDVTARAGESTFDKDKRQDLKDYPSGQPYQEQQNNR